MRRLGLLLNFYQSPVQHESVFRQVVEECYLPLTRLIREKRIDVTLNIPLGLLEQMERYGYREWIEALKGLVDSEKVEVVGSGAYFPLLTKMPLEQVEKQIVLNEYGLGYYFGQKGGFEGDPSILIQNLRGFYPPALSVNNEILNLLNEFGYDWVIVNDSVIPKEEKEHALFEIEGIETKIIANNKKIGSLIQNKKDLNTKDTAKHLLDDKDCVVCLDAETFGYINSQGILLFEYLIDSLREENIKSVFVTEFVATNSEKGISKLVDGATPVIGEVGLEGGSKIQKLQWEIYNKLFEIYKPKDLDVDLTGLEEIPIWIDKELEKIENENLRNVVELGLLVEKYSDLSQFLWSGEKDLKNGLGIKRFLTLIEVIAEKIGDNSFSKYVKEREEKIESLLQNQ